MLITLVGDNMIEHRVRSYGDPGFLSLLELVRGADVAIANHEGCAQDLYESSPAYFGGGSRAGTFQGHPPFMPEELRWMGFQMVFTANNHCMDFGETGVGATLKYVRAAGLEHAGTGLTLEEACQPAYFDTPKGRVALIGVSDWGPRFKGDLQYPWPITAFAADPDGTFKSRPGANLLRFEVATHVDAAGLDALRRLSTELGWEDRKARRNRGSERSEPLPFTSVYNNEIDTDTQFHFMGRRFVLDDKFTFETVAYEADIARNCRWVREARQKADIVIVGLHQQGAFRSDDESAADHSVALAHAVIDAGADLFVVHGADHSGGVEFYHGKPAVYGVPDFVQQLDHTRRSTLEQRLRWELPLDSTPADFLEARKQAEGTDGSYERSFKPRALVRVSFDESFQPEYLEFHPYQQGGGLKGQLGMPFSGRDDSVATEKTLTLLTHRNEMLGTRMTISDGIGYVRVKEQGN